MEKMADVLGDVVPDPFPARSKSVLADVGGLKTHLTVMHFADKILVTIAQNGRLPIWVCLIEVYCSYGF